MAAALQVPDALESRMSPTPKPDHSHVIVTACLGAVVAGLAVAAAPELLPVLALAITVFAVLISLLRE